jgi:hypothetical protein
LRGEPHCLQNLSLSATLVPQLAQNGIETS